MPAGTGKHAAKIVAAVARELAGFIWDIARHTPAPASKADRRSQSTTQDQMVAVRTVDNAISRKLYL